jgi:hypothetical protein
MQSMTFIFDLSPKMIAAAFVVIFAIMLFAFWFFSGKKIEA